MRRLRTFAEAVPRMAGLVALAGLATMGSLLIGPGIPWSEWGHLGPTANLILWELRLPRALCALLVGAGLAASGAVVQGMLRNPLASGEVLGISAGASAGALAMVALLGWSSGAVLGALGGATLVALLVLLLSTSRRVTSLSALALAGMALSSLFTGVSTLLLTLGQETQVAQYLFWLVGSLEGRRWNHLLLLAPLTLGSLVVMLSLAGRLNVLALGETTARTLGLGVQPLKLLLLGSVVVASAASVSVSGAIGFVGLLVPHMVRMAWGQDSRWFVPLSALAGAAFLVVADALVRLAFGPFEIPVGVLTALLGAPVFLWLLLRRPKGGAG